MHTERLEELRSLLSSLATDPERTQGFYLTNWISDRLFRRLNSDRPDCGTCACAIGFACSHPPFIAQGLSLSDDVPNYQDGGYTYSGWQAVMTFFEITNEQAHSLFSSFRYPDKDLNNPLAVAERIAQFLANPDVFSYSESFP